MPGNAYYLHAEVQLLQNYRVFRAYLTGYKSAVHPGVTHIFQSAAMRIGHTLVPPGVFRRTGYDQYESSFLHTIYSWPDVKQYVCYLGAANSCRTLWLRLEIDTTCR